MSSKTIHRADSEELRLALEQELSLHLQAVRRVVKLHRHVSAYSSSCTIENLGVELDNGQRLQLVLKDLSPASLLATARKVRPHFLYHPRREVETYRNLLNPQRLGTATCFGAVNSVELERYWLFLERVKGPLLWQMGRIESWELAARWLARLHSDFNAPKHPQSSDRFAHLLHYDEGFYWMWLRQAEDLLRHKRVRTSPESRRGFGRLASHYDRVVTRLMELPRTFIHGEFYPSNVILRATTEGRRVCPIDWEVAGVAPGLIDLAALTSGKWKNEQKVAMVAAYREALKPTKNWPPSLADLLEAVDYCQLHLSVQMLGWASDWSPPAQHAQNWLREACRLAHGLGL